MKDKKNKKKIKIFILAGIIIIIAGYFIIKGIISNKETTSTKYTLETVKIGNISNTLSNTGQVYSSEETELKSSVNSTVLSVVKSKGDTVKKGDIIAILDSSDISNDLISAQINYEKAKNNYEEAIAPMDEVDLIQIETSLQNAKNNLENLKTEQPVTLKKTEDTLTNSYESAVSSIDSNFTTLATVINDMRKILYLTDTLPVKDLIDNDDKNINFDLNNYLNVEIPTYWNDVIFSSIFDSEQDKETFINLIKRATASYKVAKNSYDTTVSEYRNLSRNSSREEIESTLNSVLEMDNYLYTAFRDLNNVYNYYIDYNTQRLRTIYAVINSYNSTLKSDSNSINSYINSIKSAKDNITKSKESLDNLIKNQPTELKNAENNVKIQQANYDKAIKGITDLEKRSYQLAISQASAKLTQLQETLDDYMIVAPFDGVIAKMNITTGDSVSGNTSIATIISDHSVAKLVFNEVDIAKVKLNQKAKLTFDALDNVTLTGTVTDVDTVGTTSAGVVYYTVSISFDSEHELIKPGMSVTADITIDNKENVLIVPNSAIKTIMNNSFVEVAEITDDKIKNTRNFVVDADSITTTRKNIIIGISDDSNTEIISGLEEGEVIVSKTTVITTSKKKDTKDNLNNLFGNSNSNSNTSFNRSGTMGGNSNRSFNSQNRPSGNTSGGMMPPSGF